LSPALNCEHSSALSASRASVSALISALSLVILLTRFSVFIVVLTFVVVVSFYEVAVCADRGKDSQ
jgi:hypothetical protein